MTFRPYSPTFYRGGGQKCCC